MIHQRECAWLVIFCKLTSQSSENNQIDFGFVVLSTVSLFVLLLGTSRFLEDFYAQHKEVSCADFSIICNGFEGSLKLLSDKGQLSKHLEEILECKIASVCPMFDFQERASRVSAHNTEIELAEKPAQAKGEGQTAEKPKEIKQPRKPLDISSFKNILFVSLSRQEDVKKVLTKSLDTKKKLKTSKWTFGIIKDGLSLDEKQREFYQRTTLQVGINPQNVNWKYKSKSSTSSGKVLRIVIFFVLFYGLLFALPFIYSFYFKFYMTFLRNPVYLSLVCLEYYGAKAAIMIVEVVLTIGVGFITESLKGFFLNKTTLVTLSFAIYFIVQAVDSVLVFAELTYILTEKKGAMDVYGFLIDYVIAWSSLGFFVFKPVIRQINFNLLKRLFYQFKVKHFPKNITQKESDSFFYPVSHDISLGLAYAGSFVVLAAIYSVINPLFYLLIALVLLLNFWIEKAMLLKFFKRGNVESIENIFESISAICNFALATFLMFYPVFLIIVISSLKNVGEMDYLVALATFGVLLLFGFFILTKYFGPEPIRERAQGKVIKRLKSNGLVSEDGSYEGFRKHFKNVYEDFTSLDF